MRRLFALVVCLALLTGCGYSFRGMSNALPSDVRRVSVPTSQNSTTETSLTITLTNELVRQFTISKFLRVTDINEADAVLETKITSVQTTSGAQTVSGSESLSRRVTVTVDAVLKRTGGGEVLWQNRNVVSRQSYGVADDQSVVESNVSDALDAAAVDLAEKIHNGIFESF